jgi:hypothetical protein
MHAPVKRIAILWVLIVSMNFSSMAYAEKRVRLEPSPSPSPSLPSISTYLKPQLWKRLTEDKEILVHAALDKVPQENLKNYSFYAAMLVNATLDQARKALTDYRLYAQIIPYIDRADYSSVDHRLKLEGGLWSFKLRSEIQFEEMQDRWIQYKIVAGHFRGLAGNIYFEPLGEKGTVVYFKGEKQGYDWPPTFVIERGAEIVFGFTANRMRSYIESQKKLEKGASHGEKQGQQFPQPRSHL